MPANFGCSGRRGAGVGQEWRRCRGKRYMSNVCSTQRIAAHIAHVPACGTRLTVPTCSLYHPAMLAFYLSRVLTCPEPGHTIIDAVCRQICPGARVFPRCIQLCAARHCNTTCSPHQIQMSFSSMERVKAARSSTCQQQRRPSAAARPRVLARLDC
jgi:hypothetical protein